MTRLLQPFVIAVTVLLAGAYVYVAARLASGPWGSGLLAIPFVLVWIVPVIYWGERRDRKETRIDGLVHQASYLSMAWVSFILVGTFSRDLVLLVTALLSLDEVHRAVAQQGIPVVLVASL